eukprot:2366326-Karenia_brevis.AAC.1
MEANMPTSEELDPREQQNTQSGPLPVWDGREIVDTNDCEVSRACWLWFCFNAPTFDSGIRWAYWR